MEKTIKIDGQDVRVEMSADTLRVYRKTFNRDLLRDMQTLQETFDLEVMENLMYICAAACDQLPPIDEWLKQFSPIAIYEASADLISLWLDNGKTTTERKKKADR